MEMRSVPGSNTLFDISSGVGNREVGSIVYDIGPLGWDSTDSTFRLIDNRLQLEKEQQGNKNKEKAGSDTITGQNR